MNFNNSRLVDHKPMKFGNKKKKKKKKKKQKETKNKKQTFASKTLQNI